MCYLLAIGATTDPMRLAALFEERLEVEVIAAQSPVLAAFPAEDVVRLLTRRGCSCELLELHAPANRVSPAGSIRLTPACRCALARAASELGTISVYVKSGAQWRPSRIGRIAVTIEELYSRASVPADILVDVAVGISTGDLH